MPSHARSKPLDGWRHRQVTLGELEDVWARVDRRRRRRTQLSDAAFWALVACYFAGAFTLLALAVRALV